MSLSTTCGDVNNFGQPGCIGILERPEKLCFVKTTADDGTENAILLADIVNNTFVTDLINQTDKSKAWFPSGVINKVNDTRGDNNTFEIDGFEINVSDGVRVMAFTVIDGASPQTAEAYNALGNKDVSFWSWSVTGQIGGNDRVADKLLPFRIKKKTMQAIYQPPNKENETPAMVLVQFAISQLEDDNNIAFMDAGTGDNDVQVDITSFTGLIDVTMVEDAAIPATVSTFTLDLSYIYGAVFGKQPFKGGDTPDFTVAEISPTPAPAPLDSVTEVSDGKYAFLLTAPQISGDVLRVTFAKTAYDPAGTVDITIP